MDQLAPPFFAKHADHAEVDKCDAIARQIKQIAGMRVRVEEPVHYNHFYHRGNPAAGKNLAVETRTIDERPGWRPEQAVSVEEALQATCVLPAWLEHEEHRRGTLRPGRLADLVVLDRDPVTCPPAELSELRVLATMLAGRFTYVAGDGPVAT